MQYITILLIILTTLMLISFTVRIVNTIKLKNVEIPILNSADNNISSSKIAELCEKFISYMGCKDVTIKYGESEHYCNPFKMLNRKKKEVNIPKWIMPSVGYELDYILGSIWLNASIYNNEKAVLRYKNFVLLLPLIGNIIFYLFFVATLIIQIIYWINPELIVSNKIVRIFFDYPITGMISLIGFVITAGSYLVINGLKINLEQMYENTVSVFVQKECMGYKHDVAAARVFAIEIERIIYPIISSRKTSEMKFTGPFVCY